MKLIEVTGKLANNKASNKSQHLVYQPFSEQFAMNLQSLNIVHSLLKGTESKEWLTLAEDKVYQTIKSNQS